MAVSKKSNVKKKNVHALLTLSSPSMLASVLLVVSSFVFWFINRDVRQPYLDEIFHVPQTEHYCYGDYLSWDPKITTLPGFYLINVSVLNFVSTILSIPTTVLCTLRTLRAFNLAYLVGTYFVLNAILNTQSKSSTRKNAIIAFILALFPLNYFFSFLYYTDVGSTFWVLLAYWFALKNQSGLSGLAGAIAVSFRQTNIIWVAYTAFILIAQFLADKSNPITKGAFKNIKISSITSPRDLVKLFITFLVQLRRHFVYIIFTIVPAHVLVVIGFIGFVYLNGGIVVGDKSNHVATLHFPQLFYFVAFLFGFTIPVLGINEIIEGGKRLATYHFKSLRNIMKLVFVLIVMGSIVHYFTIEHIFLLSDNRHYTFYLWKNVYRFHASIRYLLIPGYIFAGYVTMRRLSQHIPLLNAIVYYTCVALVLVPSPLLEFRYFIIPYYLYRTSLGSAGKAVQVYAEFMVFVIVNAVTIWKFLEPVRTAHGWEGELRLMW